MDDGVYHEIGKLLRAICGEPWQLGGLKPEIPIHDVLVLGAGLSGLKIAGDLLAAGRRVRVIDKAAGVGGRAATRRWDGVPVDHGAQFFTARSPEFRAQVDRWLAEEICFRWTEGFHRWDEEHGLRDGDGDGHPRFACHRGMSALGKSLAAGLTEETLQMDTRVVRLCREADGQGKAYWLAESETGAVGAAYAAVLTCPTPQTLALLDDSGLSGGLDQEALAKLRAVEYAPTLAVLVRGDAAKTPWQGIQLRDKILSWIGADTSKREGGVPMNGGRQVFVLHGSQEFSREQQDGDLEQAADLMVARAGEIVGGWITRLADRQVHRWRFANVPHGVESEAGLQLAGAGGPPLYAAGDAFLEAKIEGAYRSGAGAAKIVLADVTAVFKMMERR